MIPAKTEWMKEQMAHQPTKEYSESIQKIVKKFKYKNALEIGCRWGVSTLSILTSGTGNLLSVDVIPIDNPAMKAKDEIEVNSLSSRWSFIGSSSKDFWKSNSKKFDLIYVDGSHLYEDVLSDLFNAWEALELNGVLLVDDSLHRHNVTSDYGVSLAVLELIEKHSIKDINFLGKLMYIKKCKQ